TRGADVLDRLIAMAYQGRTNKIESSFAGVKRIWRGHWNLRKIEHRREPPRATCNDAVEPDSRSRSSARPGQMSAPTTQRVRRRFSGLYRHQRQRQRLLQDLNLG